MDVRTLPQTYRQLLPVLYGELILVSFGMALGWPCFAVPYLLNANASIPITLDESALIAGLLMDGNALGVLFSGNEMLPAKVAVCVCALLQILGWLIMYYSKNILWLFGSRFLVGIGNGYGTGQLKRFASATCSPEVSLTIITFLPLAVNAGVAITIISGAFVDFRTFGLCALSVPIIGFVLFAITPQLQSEDKRASVVEDHSSDTPMTFVEVMRDDKARSALLLLFLTIFAQQYSGGPAVIVYTQIIFSSARNRHPKLCAIIYALVACISMLVALIFASKTPRKINLLVSNIACIVSVGCLALYFFLLNDVDDISEVLTWIPLALLMLFNLFHTFSFGMLPTLQLKEVAPKRATKVLSTFAGVHFSLSAVLSTKIFQVIFETYNMSVAFTFFGCVLCVHFIIAVCLKYYTLNEKEIIDKSTAV